MYPSSLYRKNKQSLSNRRRHTSLLRKQSRDAEIQIDVFGPIYKRKWQLTVECQLRYGEDTECLKPGMLIEWDAQLSRKVMGTVQTKIIAVQHCSFGLKNSRRSQKEELRVVRSDLNSASAGVRCELII